MVDLPPGTERGVLVDRTALRKAGVESAPSYRLTLSLAFWWHDPGKMRTPTQRGGKGRGKLWLPLALYALSGGPAGPGSRKVLFFTVALLLEVCLEV